MRTSPTQWLAITACMVGLSVGLPAVLDEALRVLAHTDLDLKGFYKALETHDFKKAGDLYDEMKVNEEKLKKDARKVGMVKTQPSVHVERFLRLSELQMKLLIEKMSAITDNEREDGQQMKNEEPEKKEDKRKSAEQTKRKGRGKKPGGKPVRKVPDRSDVRQQRNSKTKEEDTNLQSKTKRAKPKPVAKAKQKGKGKKPGTIAVRKLPIYHLITLKNVPQQRNSKKEEDTNLQSKTTKPKPVQKAKKKGKGKKSGAKAARKVPIDQSEAITLKNVQQQRNSKKEKEEDANLNPQKKVDEQPKQKGKGTKPGAKSMGKLLDNRSGATILENVQQQINKKKKEVDANLQSKTKTAKPKTVEEAKQKGKGKKPGAKSVGKVPVNRSGATVVENVQREINRKKKEEDTNLQSKTNKAEAKSVENLREQDQLIHEEPSPWKISDKDEKKKAEEVTNLEPKKKEAMPISG